MMIQLGFPINRQRLLISSLSTLFLLLGALILTPQTNAQSPVPTQVSLPLGGNAYIIQGTENGAQIKQEGLTDWSNQKTITSVYFGVRQPGQVSVALKIKNLTGSSQIAAHVNGHTYALSFKSGEPDSVHITTLNISKAGYIRIDLQGIKRSGADFGTASNLILTGTSPLKDLVYVTDEKDFHFGRRGPSVHWNFVIPAAMKNKVEYFYNEVYVPKGQDIIGSYFEADGFSYGYFGMQVNSDKERRVLFSVWSPFQTDHPEEIPHDQRIKLVKKGANVHGGAFGGEGSGGQSYLTYNWLPDTHYAFLLKAAPDSATNTTTFTAYFQKAGDKNWMLIASFKRPQTLSSLNNLYAFLENFSPPRGNITRRGYYTNQWIRSFDGQWAAIKQARFTTDATGNAGQRLDYYGGVDAKGFFLENCGFFDQNGPEINKTIFDKVGQSGPAPKINFDQLP